jgi:uncharacterized RDD family membrane protein YckC
MDWYYSDGQQQFGPVTQGEFDTLVASGRIGANTLVWRAGMANWAAFATVQPPAPVVAPQPIAPIAAAPFPAASPQQPQWQQPAQPQWPQQPQQAQPQQPQARFCTNCGRPFAPGDLLQIGNATVCASCKDVMMQRLREGAVPGGLLHQGRQYAGFWIRFVAVFIDGIILNVVGTVIYLPFMLVLGGMGRSTTDPTVILGSAVGIFSVLLLLNVAIAATYESWFVANKGATPGKMVLSLEVIRTDGTRPGGGLAIGRFFAKQVSALTLGIGYIMAGLDDEKRALHDRICNTRVIRK